MKITKLLLLSLAVIFFACGDDDDPQPTSQGMVGAWSITAVDYKGTTTNTAQGVSIKADFTGTGKDMNLTATFTETPNAFTSAGSYTIVSKTTIGGQTTTEEYSVDEFLTNGTWSLDGKTLTITSPNGSEKATITEQTSTTLKMKLDVVETETGQGFSIKSEIQATYTFKKK